MLNMEKELKRNNLDNLEPPENAIHIHDYTDDCRGLVMGDEDILWLHENGIWLFRCGTCRSIYYAHKDGPWQRRCPYCRYQFNTPLMDYDDLRDVIQTIEELDPYNVKSLQQAIEEQEEKE